MSETLLPKFALGTAALGLDYGIANRAGKLAREDAFSLLDCAVRSGIRVFDTASGYGDAEEILGEFAASDAQTDEISIVTKISANTTSVKEEILGSLRRTRQKTLNGCLLHNPAHMHDEHIVSALKKCREEGLVENIGVSIYEPEDALFAARSDAFQYIQIPYNVFDKRLLNTPFFAVAKEQGKTVFARSVFLQGALLMEAVALPEHLRGLEPFLKEFQEISARHGLSRMEAALLYSCANPGIQYVVLGALSVRELQENLAALAKIGNPETRECMEELRASFMAVPKELIMPTLWEKN
ncbi:aldo/keto reductase [bacterium]|nr:aldo/keto reductase [bacterium]